MGGISEPGDWASGIDWCPGLRLGLMVCALSSTSGLSSSAVVFSRAKYRKRYSLKLKTKVENGLPWSFVKEIPSSKSSSQLSVCSSGGCRTNDKGWIFSTRLSPGLLPDVGPFFHPEGPDEGCEPSEVKEVDCGISAVRDCVGELGRGFLEGCFDNFDGANRFLENVELV